MYVSVQRTYPLMNDAYCMTSPEMPDVEQYLLMYVHGIYCLHFLAERCPFLSQVLE
jgi:hypothetical protein